MTTSPFPIRTPRDLLRKAARELQQLEGESEGTFGEPNPLSVADLAYNTACTLWHVTDWILNSDDPKVRAIVAAKGCTTSDPKERAQAFQNQLHNESGELEICHALALHFKHFELYEDSNARGVIEDDGVYMSLPVVNHTSQGAAHAAAGPGDMTLHAKVNVDGERLRVTDVYREAYSYLDRLLNKHKL